MAQLEGRGQGLRKEWSPDVPLSHPILGLGPKRHQAWPALPRGHVVHLERCPVMISGGILECGGLLPDLEAPLSLC